MAYEYPEQDFERQIDADLVNEILAGPAGGDVDAIRHLVADGANVNARATYDSAETPLHLAILNGKRPEIIQALINLGADVNAQTNEGLAAPLHYAATASEPQSAEYMRLLIAAGADVHAIQLGGVTALHMTGDPDAARVLIAAGADVNARDKRGRTPLHNVENVVVACVLVESGADVGAVDNGGMLPEDLATDPGVRSYFRSLGVQAVMEVMGNEMIVSSPAL